MGSAERILELEEEELRTAQYNKATEHHSGQIFKKDLICQKLKISEHHQKSERFLRENKAG